MSEVCRVCGRLSNHAFHDRDALPRPTRVRVAKFLEQIFAYAIDPPPPTRGKHQALADQAWRTISSRAEEVELPIHKQCAPQPGKRKLLQKHQSLF